MTKLFSACAIAAFLLTACQDNQPDRDNSIVPAAKTTSPSATTPVTDNTALPVQQNQQMQQAVQPVTNTPVTVNSAPPVTAGLNPPHGQPNHRCDIAVGAPLNSPAAAPAKMMNNTTSPQMIHAPSATPGTGNATGRINPPHGQPGHDCAVPVGQPLKG